jgi:hypothetical protein
LRGHHGSERNANGKTHGGISSFCGFQANENKKAAMGRRLESPAHGGLRVSGQRAVFSY